MSAFYEEGLTEIHAADYGEVALSGAAMVLHALHAVNVTSGLIVELGCGPGLSARQFVDAGFDVEACDVSASMVKRARALVPEATIICCDLEAFPWPEQAVAVVAFGEVLSYADSAKAFDIRLQQILDRTHQVLSDGGRFVFDLVLVGRTGPTLKRHLHHDRDAYELTVDAVEDPPHRTLDRWIHGTTKTEPIMAIDETHRQITSEVDDIMGLLLERGYSTEFFGDYRKAPIGVPGWGIFSSVK